MGPLLSLEGASMLQESVQTASSKISAAATRTGRGGGRGRGLRWLGSEGNRAWLYKAFPLQRASQASPVQIRLRLALASRAMAIPLCLLRLL